MERENRSWALTHIGYLLLWKLNSEKPGGRDSLNEASEEIMMRLWNFERQVDVILTHTVQSYILHNVRKWHKMEPPGGNTPCLSPKATLCIKQSFIVYIILVRSNLEFIKNYLFALLGKKLYKSLFDNMPKKAVVQGLCPWIKSDLIRWFHSSYTFSFRRSKQYLSLKILYIFKQKKQNKKNLLY